tara:strand:+ start:844 stop:1077 length:234 start_codon:yes stop_codon:yes gene_type:complete
MTHSSLDRIAEVIQEVIESEIASQLDDLKAEVTDLTAQIEDCDNKLEVKNEELVDDERVRELIRDFINDGGIEITAS